MKKFTSVFKSCFGKEKEPEEDDQPTPEEEEAHREATKGRYSRPMQLADAEKDPETEFSTQKAHGVSYTTNWAGALLTSPPTNQRYTGAWGTFTVPKAHKGKGTADRWSAAAWVGIDGASYSKAILQAGVDFYIDSNGKRYQDAWYEWYPAGSGSFPSFHPKPGHVVTIGIEAETPSKGKVYMTNHNTGHRVEKDLTAPSADSHLGGKNAEWIVEDFMIGDSMVPFCDFNTVNFRDCHARTGKEKGIGLANASIVEMVSATNSSNVITKVAIGGKHKVGVSYKG